MQIAIETPIILLWIILGADLVAIASILLKKGKLLVRLIAVAAVAVLSAVLLLLVYRPHSLSLTAAGIVDGTYGRRITTPWSEVREARLVRDFAAGEYRPTLKVNGNGLARLKTGWFKLANGRTARVLIQSSADALLLETEHALYLLAPDRLAELVAAVREQTNVTE
jgi:hypothetical protein